MRISGAPRLDDQITIRAQADSYQVVVDGARSQQAVKRHTRLTDVAV